MRVAVLGGGRSPEHDVSLRGARAVADGLRTQGHDVVEVVLSRDGRWLVGGEPLALHPGEGLLDVDCVFPVLHGPGGEDGSVQGLLELLDVPYVGSGVLSSAVSLDKLACKDAAAAAGLPQVDYVRVDGARWAAEPEAVLAEVERLAKPWWVKAASGGSSLGMEPVSEAGELPAAIERCRQIDHRVIIEAAATGLEIECAVLGGSPGETRVSEPGQIVVNTGGWYDHDAKYTPGGMDLIVPAPLPPGVVEQVKALCLRAYAHAGNHGLARVDCFVDLGESGGELVEGERAQADGEPCAGAASKRGLGARILLNEINTLPGFTATSVYSRLWAASGLQYGELLDALLDAAVNRPRRLPIG